MRTPLKTLGVGLVLISLAGACSKGTGSATSPSSAFPSGTPQPTGGNEIPSGVIGGVPAGALGSGGVLPSASPGAGTGNISSGQVAFTASGDIEAKTTLTQLLSAVYSPPPGGMALVWTAGGSDPETVGLGGASFVGTRPTSATLILSLVAIGNTSASFTSTDGECTVTVDTAGPTNIAGSFACKGLQTTSGAVVDVSGTFRAGG
jgi:hypothetical protein